MLLIKTTIRELIEYVSLWNNEYGLNMKFHGDYGKHVLWTLSNVLVTATEIAPCRILFEFDNFDLQGTDKGAQKALTKLSELLRESFVIDSSQTASQVYGVMERQSTRSLRIIPPFFADSQLDAETEANFKQSLKEKTPHITEYELTASWQSFCELVEQQKIKYHEQVRRRDMTADAAAADWLKTATKKVQITSHAPQLSRPENNTEEEDLSVGVQSEAIISRSTMESSTGYQYDIAISFAGEDRGVASALAGMLVSRGFTVFYDAYEQATLWGEDLYTHLADVYSNRSKYCLMLISKNYETKTWTNHERRHAQARAFQEHSVYILPIKLDDTVIPGIPQTVGYVDFRQSSLETIVDLVEKKFGRADSPKGPASISTSRQPLAGEDIGIPVPVIRRRITQRDKDTYLRDSFEVIKNYFQRGLRALEIKYPEIETEFTEIHALKFTCKIYLAGESRCQCKLWLGGFSKSDSICYYEGRIEIDRDNTMNGSLYVIEDEGNLYLQSSLLWSHSQSNQTEPMTHGTAAESLWERFTDPLKA